MDAPFRPHQDLGRLLIGTPGIIGLTAAKAAIEVVAEAGIGAVAAKARALTHFGLELCDRWGLASPTPREGRRRGGHFSVGHADAAALTDRLAADGVIADFRPPDLLRLGCSPLTTRFTDVYDGVARIATFLA
jgi:kynureninase